MSKQVFPPTETPSKGNIPSWVWYVAAGFVIAGLIVVYLKNKSANNENENG